MTHNVLSVCVENAGRSQIAEAFFRRFIPELLCSNAGTDLSLCLNPIVIQAMKEVGIDMTIQHPKLLSNSMICDSTRTINMGCMDTESCPSLFVQGVIDWSIDDPKEKSLEQVSIICDDIRSKILHLIQILEAED